MKELSLLTLMAVFITGAAQAENVYSDQFQTIQSVDLYEIELDENGNDVEKLVHSKPIPNELEELINRPVQKSDIGSIIMVTKQLIALGKEIYKIVEAGKPVVTLNSEPVQILPRDEQGATVEAFELSGWRAPRVQKYRVKTKNYLGMSPASFDFMLIYSYGGKYRGKGAFITGAQIKPTAVDVKWGYKLDAQFKVQSIMNQGSESAPIAGAVLMIDYNIKTVLQNRSDNKTFFINGLGQTTAY